MTLRTLVLCAAILIVASCTSRASATPKASMPTVSSIPSAAASPTPAPGWQLLPPQPELGGAFLTDIATFRGTLIVVGNTDIASDVIWSSSDAKAWKAIAAAALLPGTRLAALAVGDPGVVAVGHAEAEQINQGADSLALFSSDGNSWTRHVLPDSDVFSEAIAVAWARGRFVAVGGGGNPSAPLAWTSADGRAWTPVSILKPGELASLNGVAAGRDLYVVDGMVADHPVVWTSVDAATWTRSDLPGSPTDDAGSMRYTGGRFIFPIAGGGLWDSIDGRHWTKTVVPGFGVGAFDVAAIPGGFVAIGRSSEGSEPGAVAVADSGLTGWRLLPAVPLFESSGFPSTITISPDGAYLVGVGIAYPGGSVFLYPDPASLLTR